jgi:hypothetical protein
VTRRGLDREFEQAPESVVSNVLPSEMFEHYEEFNEAQRLSQGVGELERLRTQALIERRLPQRLEARRA